MSEKPLVEVPIVRTKSITVDADPRKPAIIAFETAGDADIRLVLPMSAIVELEAMLAKASQEQAKRHPKQ